MPINPPEKRKEPETKQLLLPSLGGKGRGRSDVLELRLHEETGDWLFGAIRKHDNALRPPANEEELEKIRDELAKHPEGRGITVPTSLKEAIEAYNAHQAAGGTPASKDLRSMRDRKT